MKDLLKEEVGHKMSILEKLGNVDRRVIYWIVVFCIAIPYIRPLGIPISISNVTQTAYNEISKLNQNSIVWFAVDIGVGGLPELGGGIVAVFDHVIKTNAKIILVTGALEGTLLINDILIPKIEKETRTYGIDYVNLGYFSGEEVAKTRLATDIRSVIPNDIYETTLDEIPIMANINQATDIDLVICFDSGISVDGYVRQWQSRFNTKIIGVFAAVIVPQHYPFFPTQIVGMIPGQRGCAEYELLIGKPGDAIKTSDVMSVSHIFMIFLIILGNIQFIASKYIKGDKRHD